MLNGLDLFSGIGGLSYALAPWVRPIAYCENDRYAQGVLLSRQADDSIVRAPIWDDVRSFPAKNFVGAVDIIYGGFPCQDISAAGLGKGLEGERSGLFFEIIRLVEEIRPTFVFLENVPAIRTRGLARVLSEFASLRYDCRWTVVSAAEVGAPHLRKRWFLLAHTQRKHLRDVEQRQPGGWSRRISSQRKTKPSHDGAKESLADNDSAGQSELQRRRRQAEKNGRAEPDSDGWWDTEPDVGGTLNGLSNRMDRGGGLGDAEAEETGAEEILRYLRKGNAAQAVWNAVRGLDCFQTEEILLSFVREYEGGCRIPREFLASTATPEGLLRAMRSDQLPSRASLRRGQAEQFFREYPDALREVSQLVASRGETPWAHPIWESGVERVSEGVPNRVDRLRGLGNAVVPLQARTAFERLIGI